MPTISITIINRLGLHARAAAKFVQTAAAYTCEISVAKGATRVNGKSIMGLMMLAASRGSELVITTNGTDAEPALAALVALISNKFGEFE
ncbi:MAG: HPr family phosphocarrier protein [Gammaproteobacteria bacterium]|nr:HPr family phosphocarrier protein [Gammaproteobacteria bacterium]